MNEIDLWWVKSFACQVKFSVSLVMDNGPQNIAELLQQNEIRFNNFVINSTFQSSDKQPLYTKLYNICLAIAKRIAWRQYQNFSRDSLPYE